MKITIRKKEYYKIYRTVTREEEVDIDPKLLAEIESGENEDWGDIEEWAEQWADDNDIDDVVEEDDTYIEEDECPDYEVEYDKDELETA